MEGVRRRLRQVAQSGMAVQISLLVVACVVLVNAAVTIGLHWLERSHSPPGLAEQAGAVVRALEAVPVADREAVAAAFPGVSLVACGPEDFAAAPRRGPGAELLASLGQSLGPDRRIGIVPRPDPFLPPPPGGDGPLSAGFPPAEPPPGRHPPHDHDDHGHHGHHGRHGPHHDLRLTVGLSWGQCARLDLVHSPPPRDLTLGRVRMPLGPVLVVGWSMALLVALLSVWATWRVTRPLSRLADSADRLGREGATAPLTEEGPREIRRAAAAFNLMQERLHRFIESRTRMLAAISHDYRTILTRLRLRAEDIADPELQSRMLRDFERMETMVESTLAFVRGDRVEEAVEWIDLPSLLSSLCDHHTDLGHQVSYDGPPSLRCRCRPGGMERAIANLLDNAVKYGGRVRVTLRRPDPATLEIAIADDGPGIPPEEREKVFDPFYRLDAARTPERHGGSRGGGGGVGLGLSIARGIVTGHGGQILLEDARPHGLVARILLPLAVG